ncbi:MAG TPA: arginine deiminase-related protein, partial [Saprospiraceae bacterium]|nr:arginine deiminase-related protein [Saprospiraceae bacterium]
GSIYTYPMESAIRRKERREDIIQSLEKDFQVTRRYSLELFELQQQYLEGTGSLVLDRKNKLAYACLSPRTDVRVLHKFGLLSGYEVIYFEARDKNGYSIYHTNVLMAMGLDFVICCMDAVDAAKREYLETVFAKTGKELVSISFEQMEHFAGNMLQVRAADGSPYLIMSQTAYQSLTPEQLSRLKAKTRVLVADIPTIESIGGGSVRCMMAENYLKPRD